MLRPAICLPGLRVLGNPAQQTERENVAAAAHYSAHPYLRLCIPSRFGPLLAT